MFGRWQLPAYLQEVTRLAIGDARRCRRRSAAPLLGSRNPPSRHACARRRQRQCADCARDSYDAGATATATVHRRRPTRAGPAVVPDHRRNDNGEWTRAATDGDWATRIEWHHSDEQWTATMTWHIPRDATAGSYRMRYLDQVVGRVRRHILDLAARSNDFTSDGSVNSAPTAYRGLKSLANTRAACRGVSRSSRRTTRSQSSSWNWQMRVLTAYEIARSRPICRFHSFGYDDNPAGV